MNSVINSDRMVPLSSQIVTLTPLVFLHSVVSFGTPESFFFQGFYLSGQLPLCVSMARRVEWSEVRATELALECLKNPFSCRLLVRSLSLPAFVVAVACSIVGAKILHKMWEGPTGKASGFAWIHGTLHVCAHHPAAGMSG